jgi:hydroxymethylbilane synthase
VKLRIATRKSRLALAQSRWVAARLAAVEPGLVVDLVELVTEGDRLTDGPLADRGGKGLFVSELEQAMLEGRADLAVHSMKDLPGDLARGLVIASVPEREDARDALVTRDGCELDDLAAGARVGTASLRRTLQLRRARNDLDYRVLRGNVDTRLARLAAGDFDAIVLACAGLTRLNLADRPMWRLPMVMSLPAVGQGALAIEARATDASLVEFLGRIEHAPTRAATEAERAFLRALGGDCRTPLAGHAAFDAGLTRLSFDGWVGSPNDDRQVRAGAERYIDPSADDMVELGRALGREVADSLLAQGARDLIGEP